MVALSDKLESIELKLRQLALKMEQLKNNNAQLLEENKNLRKNLSKQDNAIGLLEDNLQKSQNNLEIEKEPKTPPSKRTKKDIERYIREIDKCIEWLKKA